MPKRSSFNFGYIIKEAFSAMMQDKNLCKNVITLQLKKQTFNFRHQFKSKDGIGEPIQQISLRITDICNLRCHTCGQWGDSGYLHGTNMGELKKEEVTFEQYKKLIDQVYEKGWHPMWYIWGGEPMLYKNIIEVLKYLKYRKMPVALVTNGTNVIENIDTIMECCSVIFLSVDGHNALIHNTQRPGTTNNMDNFNTVLDVLKTVDKLKKENNRVVPYVIPISCIASYNVEYLSDIYKLIAPYSNIHQIFYCWWIDEASAVAHAVDFQERFGFKPTKHRGWIGNWTKFDYEALHRNIEEIKRLREEGSNCLPMFIPGIEEPKDIKEYYTNHNATFGYTQCISIYMALEINSNGNASLCRDYNDYVIGNVKDQSLDEIWNGDLAKNFRKKITEQGIMPVCTRCCGLMGF